MKKIAIFTEGQTELIFVRRLLQLSIDNSRLSFECLELSGHSVWHVPYTYTSPAGDVFITIFNVSNDERVMSAIDEREKGLIGAGYDTIIGLRDMYSQDYRQRSEGVNDDSVNMEITNGHNKAISKMMNADKIRLYFATMEIEAWFLGMYNVLERMNPKMTVAFIQSERGYCLSTIDPQTLFFHPSSELAAIFSLFGEKYTKKFDQVEAICSQLRGSDFEDAKANGRCSSFSAFHDEIVSLRS